MGHALLPSDPGGGEGTGFLHPAYSRLLQEGYVIYHESAERQRVTPTSRGTAVAPMPGLGRRHKGRGLSAALMGGGSR